MNLEFDDHELDRLFKSKAKNEGDEPEFDEAAWADMERRLDKRKRRIAFYYLSAAALLLCALSVGWFFMQNYNVQEKSEKNYVAKKTENKNSESLNSEKKSDQESLRDVEPKESVVNNQTNNVRKPGIYTRNSLAKADVSKPEKAQIIQKDKVQELAFADEKKESLSSTSLAKIDSDTVLRSESNEILIASNDVSENNDETKPKPENKASSSLENKEKSKNKDKIIWSLGLNAGPEFNTAGGLNNSQGTLNAGLNFSGRWNKLGFSVGANYGIKNYAANTSQYHNINPLYAPLITNIDASCNILEVPFTLSYQILKGKKSSFDLNAGLSSYFMLKEKYVYQYTTASGYPERTIRVNNQNKHYFKVLQLSGTYYLPLKNTSSVLGIEPYAKIPLAGVGIGAVELKSYGVNLHFNYQFKKKSK